MRLLVQRFATVNHRASGVFKFLNSKYANNPSELSSQVTAKSNSTLSLLAALWRPEMTLHTFK